MTRKAPRPVPKAVAPVGAGAMAADLWPEILFFRLEELPPEGLEIPWEIPAPQAEAFLAAWAEDSVALTAPLAGTFWVEGFGARLLVRGQVRAEVQVSCGRCLAPFRNGLAFSFQEPLKLVSGSEARGEEAAWLEDEGDQEEDFWCPVREGRINLGPLLAEQFWLAWPYRLLCRPDCRGLCPRCGGDLNAGSCGCPPEGIGERGPGLEALAGRFKVKVGQKK